MLKKCFYRNAVSFLITCESKFIKHKYCTKIDFKNTDRTFTRWTCLSSYRGFRRRRKLPLHNLDSWLKYGDRGIWITAVQMPAPSMCVILGGEWGVHGDYVSDKRNIKACKKGDRASPSTIGALWGINTRTKRLFIQTSKSLFFLTTKFCFEDPSVTGWILFIASYD